MQYQPAKFPNSSQCITPVHSISELTSFLHLVELNDCFRDPHEAFQRGMFRRIETSTFDLPPPRDPPNPSHPNYWINRLPLEVLPLFTTHIQQTFFQHVHSYLRSAAQHGFPVPPPRIHTTLDQYVILLDRADQAGMLYWTPRRHNHEADIPQMTFSAMSKSETRSRLISWPRIPNDTIPDPPYTSLSDPSLFDAIRTNRDNLSAFYVDIHNMFHNITLPFALAQLFPMMPLPLSTLLPSTQKRLRARLGLHEHAGHVLLAPFQATMPMGFKWSVYIAHTFAESCMAQAFNLFKSSRLAPPGRQHMQLFRRETAPFHVTPQQPLLLHIIDDIVGVVADWPDVAVRTWHRLVRHVFHLNRLPVSEQKSCPLQHVEHHSVPFIGCLRNLLQHTIMPDPDKVQRISDQISSVLTSRTITVTQWQRLIGRLVWLTLLNRPLLASTKFVYIPSLANLPQARFTLQPSPKREVLLLTTMLPFASVDTHLPIFNTVVAFDASLQAGAVTYSQVSSSLAQQFWEHAKQRQYLDPLLLTQPDPFINQVATELSWTKALSHFWHQQGDHINGLEASAAVLALEWAIRKGAHNTRLILLTDSLVVRGALLKGRSSSHPLSLRCKRFAALSLAQNVRVAIDYIPTHLNPADKYTRLPKPPGDTHLRVAEHQVNTS